MGFTLSSTFALHAHPLYDHTGAPVKILSDTLLGTNHLNDTLLDNGQVDIGLIDTMTDLLLSQSASFISAFCLYRAIKKDRWLSISRILITRENHQAN
ncbi:MAG TPA: hypothetical protein PK369_06715 [Thermoclostridium sp.]|nr:hypothetical protein [Thermoclostridium sp.]HPU44989.1 hypothetical protein [Thermoclostridium sp.]